MSRLTGHLGWLLAGLLMLGAPGLRAADDCASGPAGDAIQQSAFAHGYLHGYEAGFHAGDSDFHLARPRPPRELREINRPSGYRPEFGARDPYHNGFRGGFVAGYQDSVAGRDFRGFEIVATLVHSDVKRPKDFDRGSEAGYRAGHTAGAGDLEADGDFDPDKGECPAEPAGERLAEFTVAYCAGYTSAYRIGYTDGFLLPPTAAAAAGVVAAK